MDDNESSGFDLEEAKQLILAGKLSMKDFAGLPHALRTILSFLTSIPILPLGINTSRKELQKRHFFLFFARYWENPRFKHRTVTRAVTAKHNQNP
jgi:hypothetical protein